MKKTLSFPIRLYKMLEHIEQHEDYNSIIAWQSHGRCFRIHDKKRLEEELLHLLFSTKQYVSLRRSLNKWGFKQIQGLRNPDKGCYHHPKVLTNTIQVVCVHNKNFPCFCRRRWRIAFSRAKVLYHATFATIIFTRTRKKLCKWKQLWKRGILRKEKLRLNSKCIEF